ncbi:hypothetical protein T10_2314 [Trichinella papuae]|uniref:Uncharacterized protein n=1 Tax=Trichinella papuae TaxID=268474 RepID=A0A0V1MHY9_9BILA|nr:hypothetical protein T10_2314 [Trichinella papuae]
MYEKKRYKISYLNKDIDLQTKNKSFIPLNTIKQAYFSLKKCDNKYILIASSANTNRYLI